MPPPAVGLEAKLRRKRPPLFRAPCHVTAVLLQFHFLESEITAAQKALPPGETGASPTPGTQAPPLSKSILPVPPAPLVGDCRVGKF